MILDGPTRARLERLALASSRRVRGRYAGRHRSRRYGESLDFADYRPYVPGDDYRRIDHNMRARLGVTLIRLFEAEDEMPVRVLVDASRSMSFDRKMQTARELAGAVAFTALAGGDRVVMYATPGPGGSAIRRGPTGRHLAAWPAIEGWLEGLEPDGAAADGSTLRRLILEGGVAGPVVLVSDLFVRGGGDLIGGVGAASGGIVLHVLGRSELDPDVAGDLRLVDAETEDDLDMSVTEANLDAYIDRIEAFIAESAGRARRAGMEYLTSVASETALADAIAEMARREVIG